MKKGVPQGGVLSPLLYNVYLEEALLTQRTISKLLSRDDARAFADDLVLHTANQHELIELVEELH